MGFGTTFVLTILIICFSTLFGLYMALCSQNKINMFSNPKYEERIAKLEKEIKELKEK